jgi:hypothetical protein
MVMKNSGDTFQDKDRLANEVCKIIAIVRLRERMIRFLPESTFLPLTRFEGKAIVGIRAKPLTRIGEGTDFLATYYDLHRQVVGE